MTNRSSGNVGRLTNSEIVEIPIRISLDGTLLSRQLLSSMTTENLVSPSRTLDFNRVFVLSIAFFISLFHASACKS